MTQIIYTKAKTRLFVINYERVMPQYKPKFPMTLIFRQGTTVIKIIQWNKKICMS